MIPLKAIVLNLLSVGAAYGLLVLVFQHHWAEGLSGSTRTAASPRGCRCSCSSCSSASRWTTTCSSSAACEKLVDARRCRPRTRCCTGSSGPPPIGDERRSGDGGGVRDLRDADARCSSSRWASGSPSRSRSTRRSSAAVLLPATMKLLGDWNWYLPAWLDWLPRGEERPAERGQTRRQTPGAHDITLANFRYSPRCTSHAGP